ncbi:MAG: MarR family winged helix-turn-helix transcriptional regulator [Asticcacaulis sp.]|uniref:MarR family winged helix-turn-helix transcriptional regulator n=1 Tax=Asticcacaulis sp. TaxID=1872648 RepID=UPI0039E698EC
MTRNTPEFAQSLTIQLNRAAHVVTARIATVLKERYRLRLTEWGILSQLSEHGALSQTDLVRLTGYDKVSISRAAIGIVKRRLAKRWICGEDGRVHFLVLTSEGEAMAVETGQTVADIEAGLLSTIALDRAADFRAILTEVKDLAKPSTEEHMLQPRTILLRVVA